MTEQAAGSGSGNEAAPGGIRDLLSQLTVTAAVALVILISFILVVMFAPWVAPYAEDAILTDESFALSSKEMLLGSDFLGRDVLSRLLYGARVTLSVALVIALSAFILSLIHI